MSSLLQLAVIFAVTTLTLWPSSVESQDQAPGLGIGLELILTKLEQLELRIASLENLNLKALEASKTCTSTMVSKDVVQEVPVQQISIEKQPPAPTVGPDPFTIENTEVDEREIFSSCSEVSQDISGQFVIRPTPESHSLKVWCEMKAYGGGWTVIQHRFNGSLDFYRSWSDYKSGFGSLEGEFWWGLDKIHLLTETRRHEVLFELVDFKGWTTTARFDRFLVGSEQEAYVLKEVGTYTGSAGDSLRYHKSIKWSTFDRDNDAAGFSCAKKSHGAWWYNGCHESNLNGRYVNGRGEQTMSWQTMNSFKDGLKRSRIMIRDV